MSFLQLVPLVIRLVEREQAADAEEHDRDDEAEDVTLAAVAERVLRGRAPLRASTAYEEQHLVARVGDGVDRLSQHR